MFELTLFACLALFVVFLLRKKKHRRKPNLRARLISRSFSRNPSNKKKS